MGLGAPTGIDLPHEGTGLMPSPEWKQRLFKQPWYAGETVSVSIGQGQVSATPLQMARVVAVIASGGRLVRPHLVRGAPDSDPVPLGIKPSTIEAVKAGMRAVVAAGTGFRATLQTVEVAGKTGSAQVVAKSRLEKSPDRRGVPAARLVPLLRPGRRPDDRDGGHRRARQERRRVGGAGRAADPRPLLRARQAGRRRPGAVVVDTEADD